MRARSVLRILVKRPVSDEEAGRQREARGHAAGMAWLLFVLFPISQSLSRHASVPGRIAMIAGGVVFVVAYLACYAIDDHDFATKRLQAPLLALMVLDTTVLSLTDGYDWGLCFIFCSAAGAHVFPRPRNVHAVLLCTGLVIGTQAIGGAPFGSAIGYASPTIGIGFLLVLLTDLQAKNEELTAARQELAQLAVAKERERFARDLHDLLGHTLSVIALKGELAGRLVSARPDDAEREIREVQEVARTALSEVRDAVSGYRQPMIDDEIAGARVALAAAGVEPDVHHDVVALDPEIEGVLAWTIREGATNVIRHSCARTCRITVGADLQAAFAEIRDDGVARPDADEGVCSGHGLEGLSERAAAFGGRLEAGPVSDGGFRLTVTLPRPAPGTVGAP